MLYYVLSACIGMTLAVGLMLTIAPKTGIKKGIEVTDEALKKNRAIGLVFLVFSVILGVVFFMTQF